MDKTMTDLTKRTEMIWALDAITEYSGGAGCKR